MQREKQPKIYLEIYCVFQGTVPTVSQVLLREHKQERQCRALDLAHGMAQLIPYI